MNSILLLNIKPGDCKECPLNLKTPGVCSITTAVEKKKPGCPLMSTYTIEDEETPLSHTKITKIVLRHDGVTQEEDTLGLLP